MKIIITEFAFSYATFLLITFFVVGFQSTQTKINDMLLCQQVSCKVAEMMLWCEKTGPGKDGIYSKLLVLIFLIQKVVKKYGMKNVFFLPT